MTKEFLSCSWLEHGLIFDHANFIRVCCSQCNEGGGRPILRQGYHGEKLDWEYIFDLKRKMREVQRKGDIFAKCKGCILLEKKSWDEEDYIDHLLLTHWTNCNCKCIYCPAVRDEELKRINRHYNILPALQDMCEKNILKKDAFISIAGGESTIYPEFEDVLHLLLDYGCDNILLNTSGIKYSPAVAKGLSESKIKVTVSVDAGTEKMHEFIKSANVYNEVYSTLIKYIEAQGKNKNLVCSKYIIVPDVNDKESEIEQWLEDSCDIGIKQVAIDIDLRWVNNNLDNLGKANRLYDLINFTKKIADRENLSLIYDERASIIRKVHKVPTAIFGGTLCKYRGK